MKAEPDSSASENQPAGNAAGSGVDIGALETELAGQKDQYLRLAADFDNFRKRTAQETERRAAAQKEAFIRELLPVIDNLERALASDSSTSAQQLRDGVQITLQQLMQLCIAMGSNPKRVSAGLSTRAIMKLSACAMTPLNPIMSCLRHFNAAIGAVTRFFARPRSSLTI